MKVLDSQQIDQVSGGVLLGKTTTPDIFFIGVFQNETFFMYNPDTDTGYLFQDDGNVINNGTLTKDIYGTVDYDLRMAVYKVPTSFFSFLIN